MLDTDFFHSKIVANIHPKRPDRSLKKKILGKNGLILMHARPILTMNRRLTISAPLGISLLLNFDSVAME